MARMRIAALVAALVAPLAGALASTIEIGPTRVQLIGPERTATLTIRNADTTATNIQVRAMDWNQANGDDVLAPSRTLLASPPQVALAPGEAQVIRLVLERLPASADERAFRLVIDQIPGDQAPGGAGVRTAIRALVPVFVTASDRDRPKLRWEARRNGSAVTLIARNDGVVHERLIGGAVTAAGKPIGPPLEGYILAKAQRRWTIAGVPAGAAALALAGEGEFGRVRADVPIAP